MATKNEKIWNIIIELNYWRRSAQVFITFTDPVCVKWVLLELKVKNCAFSGNSFRNICASFIILNRVCEEFMIVNKIL